MGDSKEKAEVIEVLESELAKIREEEGAFEQAIENLQAEIEELQRENAQLKRQGGRRAGSASVAGGTSSEHLVLAGDSDGGVGVAELSVDGSTGSFMDAAAKSTLPTPVSVQIEALRALVRYLRLENSRLLAQAALIGGMGSSTAVQPSEALARRMAKLNKENKKPNQDPETKDEVSAPAPPIRILSDIRNALVTPKVVDLSKVPSILAPTKPTSTSEKPTRSLVRWYPRKLDPVQQYREQTRQLDKLLKEAETFAVVVARKKKEQGVGKVGGVKVGKVQLPLEHPSTRAGGRVDLDWSGLENVHRMVLAS